MLKIGFLLPVVFALDKPGNGVRRQALYQVDALRALGHDVVLLDAWQTYDLATFDVIQFFAGGFSVHKIETVPLENAILVWAPIIDSNEPNWRYRLATRLGAIHPKLFTIPGVFREQAVASDLIVARSAHERDRIVDGMGVDAGHVRIVLNGADPPQPAAADPARVATLTGDDKSYVLHVSTYTQGRKNVLNLVRAVAPTGAKLVIAGTATDGPMLDELKRLASAHPNVRLLGYLSQADRNALYAGCRVFCLPSDHEGTGLVALEAAMYGASVVITRNGGPIDYFGSLARYVDPRDVSGIRAAVASAFDEPPSMALRDHVVSRLTWRHSAQALVAAYESTIDRKRRVRR